MRYIDSDSESSAPVTMIVGRMHSFSDRYFPRPTTSVNVGPGNFLDIGFQKLPNLSFVWARWGHGIILIFNGDCSSCSCDFGARGRQKWRKGNEEDGAWNFLAISSVIWEESSELGDPIWSHCEYGALGPREII